MASARIGFPTARVRWCGGRSAWRRWSGRHAAVGRAGLGGGGRGRGVAAQEQQLRGSKQEASELRSSGGAWWRVEERLVCGRRWAGGREARLCAQGERRGWAVVDVRAVFVRAGLLFVVLRSLDE